MRIELDKALLLVIDVQEKLLPHMYQYRTIETTILLLLKGLHALNVPIMINEQYPKGLGKTVPSIFSLNITTARYEKSSFSSCQDLSTMNAIQQSHKKQIILVGIESHICIVQTAMDLLTQGYYPIVVVDCISSRKELDHTIALKRLSQEGVCLTTYESLLFELMKGSSHPKFKFISAMIKESV